MIDNILRILQRAIFLILLLFASLSAMGDDIKKETEGDRRAKGVEAQGDRRFIRQDFDKAMAVYESAFRHTLSTDYGAALHLKVARLYLDLLDYTAAIPHYESAMAMSEELFDASDVCNYLEALRLSGQRMKAIGLVRKYAYRDAYHTDQRYQNILHALNYEEGFLPIGTPEFTVRRLDNANTAYSEFWIGTKGTEYFYASSRSRFHDSNKRFYHRSNYFTLDETSEYAIKNESNTRRRLLDMVPVDLQNGPVSFSRDMARMVVTQISYDRGEGIGMTARGLNTFHTRLYYSDYDQRRKGWSSFKEVFPQKEGRSYSHPYLFNNDKSLLFASDMPGGFGGYDIYVAHWDGRTGTWGEPVNLGSQVNTEGDEISPGLFDDRLIFSSNGHVGFGGYDIYGITYQDGQAVSGSLEHFGYPVNTVHNDFGMLHIDRDRGYIISDRKITSKDDIFYFERNTGDTKKDNLLFGISEAKAISGGSISLLGAKSYINIPQEETLPGSRFAEHMLSIYFDFDSYRLKDEALRELEAWKRTVDLARIDTLVIEGYADEIGQADYNLNLSETRAGRVSGWLRDQGVTQPVLVFGRGQTPVDIDFSTLVLNNKELQGFALKGSKDLYKSLPLLNRIWLNRQARRVDIKAITK